MYKVLIIWALLIFPFINAEAQNISNEGTEFWAVFPSHDASQEKKDGPILLSNIRIWVTGKTASRVTVSCRGYEETKDIPANIPVAFNILPRDEAYIKHNESNVSLPGRAIHVKVNSGYGKVAVYAHIFAGYRSAASLILPVESLGQKYFSMNYKQDPKGGNIAQNFLDLIAVQDNTQLLITETNGNVLAVNLAKAGDVYQYMPGAAADLTGVSVKVDPASADNCNKRFAAFSGSTSLSIGTCNESRDPLFQQLYPTISWGHEYVIVPFINRRYILRIVAQEMNTNIQFNGQSIVLNEGQFFESTELTASAFVSADKKISVAQFALSQACSGINGGNIVGDPDMVILNPVEFNIKDVTLFSSKDENITERYINVSMKTSATASFQVNGQPAAVSWTAIPERPEYSFTQLNITDQASQVTRLTANDGFNATAYGFGGTESYAYSAGTNLAANNYLQVHNKITQVDAQNACIGQASDFKIVLPFKALKIIWKLDDEPEIADTPEPEVLVNGQVVSYVYIYQKNVIFSELKRHNMVVTASMPNQDNCLGSDVIYRFTFDVNPLPVVAFAAAAVVCADTEVSFIDKSVSNMTDKPINKWLWDFGDGTTASTEQSPTHVYSESGNFTVRLFAGRDDGCMAEATAFTVSVRPKINTAFTAATSACIHSPVAFRDHSTSAAGPIVSWLWDFGDGSATSAEQHPVHSYQSTGTFRVTLITRTANGCESLPQTKDLRIDPVPKVDFSLPKICVGDLIAEFENKSTNADLSTEGLTYSWNFGDLSVSPENNTSTQPEGSHQYHAAGTYTVTLVVTDANGCSVSTVKSFTVNGSDINPIFEVLDKDKLCSNRKIVVRHGSTVDHGKLVKLLWYVNGEKKLEVNDPKVTDDYELDVPVSTDAAVSQLNIELIAYSGQSCKANLVKNILLYAAPKLAFTAISPICVNAGKIKITNATEVLGVPAASWAYSGAGMAADGTFDPMEAGAGTHTLTYTYMSNAGCTESISQDITVYPLPVLTLEKDIFMLVGGEKKIDAKASGYMLSYRWSPALGLDRTDVLNPMLKLEQDATYTLTITSGLGCSIIRNVNVHVIASIQPANAFSPNGDGINDVWVLKYIDTYPNTTVAVFNRYGEKVFFSQGYSIPFDGNYKGNLLPAGVYYYMIDPKNGKKTITGSLTLIR